jgi:hypothetical protein
VIVPGVRVIEFACTTRPTLVRCVGVKVTNVGLIGMRRCTMMRATVHDDLTISLTSHSQ